MWPNLLARQVVTRWEASKTRFHLGTVDAPVRVDLSEQAFPQLFAMGAASERRAVATFTAELEAQGRARIVRSGRGAVGQPRAVVFEPEAVEEAYAAVRGPTLRGHLRRVQRVVQEALEGLDGAEPEWVGVYLTKCVEELQGGRGALLGRGWKDAQAVEDVRDAVRLLVRISSREPYEERTLSGDLVGLSKRLSKLRPRLRQMLLAGDPYWGDVPAPDEKDLFAHYGEIFKPPLTSVAGHVSVPGVMEMGAFQPYAVLPDSVMDALAHALAELPEILVTVIENESVFIRYIEEPEVRAELRAGREIVFYSGGQAGLALIALLERIRPGKERFRHWGDCDVAGVEIALRLSRAAGGGRLFRTTASWASNTPSTRGIRLTPEEVVRLERLRTDPGVATCEGTAELIAAVLERGQWFEQEAYYAGAPN